MSDVTRRSLLKGLGAAGLTAATLPGLLAAAPTVPGALNQSVPTGADVDTVVFPSGVASGDPTPTGAIVWVRAAPAAIAATPDTELVLIVARDAALTERVLTRVVAPDELALRGAERDGTVRVDIDGMLPTADTHYYYRWFLGGAASRLGRLRTTPAAGTMVNHLRFGVYSCSNYPAGQFNAYGAGARDGLDYVIHVGDWLYEGASGNGSGERDVVIESGASRMSSLADCYDIHRTYRTDPHVQDLLAMHTLIATWDDHETVNNPWYDYAAAAHDSSSHPNEGDHDFMRKYFLEAATAYHDYIPNRTFLDEQAVREQVLDNDERGSDVSPKAAFKLWRKIAFGDLLDLIMVDGRWYRTRGFDTDSSQGNDSVAATSSASEKQGTEYGESSTMLGLEQAQWVVDTIGASTARWRVLGNQTIFQSWGAMLPGPSRAYINMDAWDGYRAERATIIDAMAPKGNNVVLTGDMHAFVWGHVQTEYGVEGEATGRKVAYEMMTTSVTSTGLFFFAAPNDNVTIPGMEEALEATQLALNPHMDLFNWTRHGYIVMDVTPDHIEAVAYITGINTFEAAPKATPYFGVRIPSNPGGEVKAEVLLRRSPSGVPVSPSRPRPSQAFALPAAGAQPTQLSSWDQIESLLGDPDEVVRHYNAEL